MNNKLKIGQSFVVVEVIDHNYSCNQFKVGGHTLRLSYINHILVNGCTDNDGFFKGVLGKKTLCLTYKDTKPIGKITITKLK